MNKLLMNGLAVISAFALSLSVSAEERPTAKAHYDTDSRTLSLNADVKKSKKEFVNIIVAPLSVTVTESEILTNPNVVTRTVQTATDGTVNTNITFPSDFTGGRYMAYVYSGDFSSKQTFAVLNSADIQNLADDVSSADGNGIKSLLLTDAVTIGLDDGKTKDTAAIADYVYNVRPSTGYNKNSILKAYMCGEGIYYLNSGTKKVIDFITEYQDFLDDDYISVYSGLDLGEKNSLEQAFTKNSVGYSFDKTFNDCLFIAKYKNSKSSVELQEYLMDYFGKNGIDMSKYNSISNLVNRDNVFSALYGTKDTVNTISEIKTLFDSQVDVQKATQPTPISGGGVGGIVDGNGIVDIGQAAGVSGVFSDIGNHWAKEKIALAYQKGIVNGFEDGSFRPDKPVTRAEFAKMLADILSLDTSENADFGDVSNEAWYNRYVGAVSRAGIVFGDEQNNYRPNENITRQDAAVMLERVLKSRSYGLDYSSHGFGDEGSMSDYAKNAINALANLKIINGYDGNVFVPVRETSRAEAIVLLLKMEEYVR